MLSIWCLLFQVSGGTVQELITALRQMDHTEAIEIIQEALSMSRRPSNLEDSTTKALPSSSPLTLANGETGKIDSKIWALFKTIFHFSHPSLSRTADRWLHTFLHTLLHLLTGFRNILLHHDPSHHKYLLGLEERGKWTTWISMPASQYSLYCCPLLKPDTCHLLMVMPWMYWEYRQLSPRHVQVPLAFDFFSPS